MDNVEPGLFDRPELEPEPARKAPPSRTQTGRNRQTWSCTVTAAVSIDVPARKHDDDDNARHSGAPRAEPPPAVRIPPRGH